MFLNRHCLVLLPLLWLSAGAEWLYLCQFAKPLKVATPVHNTIKKQMHACPNDLLHDMPIQGKHIYQFWQEKKNLLKAFDKSLTRRLGQLKF